MKMVRSFMPVGQGAFYCEQFLNEQTKEIINIVYDCGSQSKTLIRKQIENTFKRGETIHAVFISHFHYDHISGLEYLLEYCDVKTIFLPMVTDENRIVLCLNSIINDPKRSDFVNMFINDPRDALLYKSKSTKIYEIESYDPDDHFEQFWNNQVVYGETKEIIRSGSNVSPIIRDLSYSDVLNNWAFIPFNYIKENDLEHLKKALEKYANYKGIEYEDLPNKITKKSIKEIRNIYLAVLRSTEHFNTNSMTMYSGDICGERYQYYYNQRVMGLNCKRCLLCVDFKKSGCLYTGDYDMSSDLKYSVLITSYESRFNKNIEEFVGCIQIPHHGSKDNYNLDISNYNAFYIISVGNRNSFGHPHAFVLKNLLLNNSCFFLVTEEHGSAVHFIIK